MSLPPVWATSAAPWATAVVPFQTHQHTTVSSWWTVYDVEQYLITVLIIKRSIKYMFTAILRQLLFSKHGLLFSVHKHMGKTGASCKKQLIILGTQLSDRLNEVHILTPYFNIINSCLVLPSRTFPPDFLTKILYILQSQWINSDRGSPDQKFHVRLWSR